MTTLRVDKWTFTPRTKKQTRFKVDFNMRWNGEHVSVKGVHVNKSADKWVVDANKCTIDGDIYIDDGRGIQLPAELKDTILKEFLRWLKTDAK
ncbi:MAG: hypothetical protein HQ553_14720 [Chloroflexi bacterium]|nr:hypothetical protein [Chloroflexota bacterium]